MTKHSAQRDAIYDCLCQTTAHPTAEEVYLKLKNNMPHLSLATVYRNLDFLVGSGKVKRIETGSAVRFDADIHIHNHVICEKCGKMYDLPYFDISNLINSASSFFEGNISSAMLMFSGVCPDCK